MNSFSENNKIVRVSNAAAAATTDITSSAVDMTGFNSCTFLVPFGTITAGAVTSVKVQQSSDDGVSDGYSDLEGTSVTVADDDDNKIAQIEVVKPAKRYLKCIVDRGTQNAVVDGIIAVLSNSDSGPVSTHSTIITAGREIHETPDEGTA